jgi:hypothetical protein
VSVLSLYARIWRTYLAWARPLLLAALVVFVPLGLIHAVPVNVDATQLDLGSGLRVAAAVLALLLLSVTGLLGEIFYTGAVAIALTNPRDGAPPSLREIAGMVKYGRLIAVDLIFAVAVAAGTIAFVVPGVLLFVYLGLTAPVVEIEHRGVRGAFARSFRLVRGRFWYVLAILVPIELGSDAVTGVATGLAHSLLGNSLFAEWLADTSTNVLLTPFYAVAAVLLTLDLIAEKDGAEPRLHSAPPAR